jgi:N-formylglutamate deformylase
MSTHPTAGMPEAAATHTLRQGTLPLLISIPHLGTVLPAACASQMQAAATRTQDTDWHLDRLNAFAQDLGASVLQAQVSRYVIDLNRPPSGESLYPGQTTTGLCPTETFHGEPLYAPGAEPSAAEQQSRLQAYWRPYHDALAQELGRLRALHGAVLLWDAHSIAGVLPRLFEGQLPDLNLGSNSGQSCAAALMQGVAAVARDSGLSHVVNGRFKGGYITRHYGQPAQSVHAIQLEMRQALYMEEDAPFGYLEARASRVQPVLQAMLQAALTQLARLPGSVTPAAQSRK